MSGGVEIEAPTSSVFCRDKLSASSFLATWMKELLFASLLSVSSAFECERMGNRNVLLFDDFRTSLSSRDSQCLLFEIAEFLPITEARVFLGEHPLIGLFSAIFFLLKPNSSNKTGGGANFPKFQNNQNIMCQIFTV